MSHKQVTRMQVLFYVILSLYYLKCLGIYSEVLTSNNSYRDLFNFVTSRNLSEEEELYLETTENSVHETLDHSLEKSYIQDFMKPELLISDPLFEDMFRNTSGIKELSRKRDIPPERGLTHDVEMQLLQLHNLYRSNVTPSAGNMAYMEWDEELAKIAQKWSDGCLFDHGMPRNDYPTLIGQNLYIGTDPTGYLGLYLWYEEYHHYDLRKDYCIPGKQCGHFVQMAWAANNKLGCGMTKCGMRYFLTCHYSPGAMKSIQMYKVAKPCSQCPEKKGTLCLQNLCITPEQCKNNPFNCQFAKCDLECLNCGRLDKKTCTCACADGWDSPDCSNLCTNKHKNCETTPGWPTKASCSINSIVAEARCRKMCEKCRALNTSISNNTCCDGKLCEEGFVLDTHENFCKCKLQCPGLLCDSEDGGELQAALESSAGYLKSKITFITYWMVIFALYFKILRDDF